MENEIFDFDETFIYASLIITNRIFMNNVSLLLVIPSNHSKKITMDRFFSSI